MSLSSAKAKLDAQPGDPATGYISKQDHKDSYDELVADTALTGATTAAGITVSGAVQVGATAGLVVGASGPKVLSGSGSPEGAVTAPVGSIYLRTDGGADTAAYYKTSGTGSTGWTAADTGTGDVVGPASATDNALTRFDGTTGKLVQNSGVTADDSGNLTATGTVSATGLAGTLARGPSVAVGRWTNQLVGPTNYSATSQGDINNRLVVWPTWNPVAITISDLMIRVSSATGATGAWRIGFYQMDGSNGVPSTLIADCGTVATTSTGFKTISSLSVTLPAGPIGIALCAQGIASVGAYQGAYGVGAYASFAAGTVTHGAFTQASVTGALPATMTAADHDGYFLPYLLVKRSA